MSVAFGIVVAAFLLAILVVALIMFIGLREPRAGRKLREAGARVRARKAEAQHADSQRRQARVKAAHAERQLKVDSDAASSDAPSRTSSAGDS
jgi:Sec-independent protein translocase protein TatA